MLLRTLIVTLLAAASGGAAGTAPPPILFAADNEPALSGDIFRLDANGRSINLTKSPFADENPLVSPDGRRVAFVSERGGGPGIYEVGIDGAGLRRLDPPPHQIGRSTRRLQLAWSPDGRLLAAVTGESKTTLRILRPRPDAEGRRRGARSSTARAGRRTASCSPSRRSPATRPSRARLHGRGEPSPGRFPQPDPSAWSQSGAVRDHRQGGRQSLRRARPPPVHRPRRAPPPGRPTARGSPPSPAGRSSSGPSRAASSSAGSSAA